MSARVTRVEMSFADSEAVEITVARRAGIYAGWPDPADVPEDLRKALLAWLEAA